MNNKYRSIPKIIRILISFLIFVGLIFLFSFIEIHQGRGDYNTDFHEKYGVYALNLPSKLDFAAEEVPLKYFDVKESLDMELHVNTYWHSRTFLMLKRANRFFPIIEPILKENNIPDDFKYLVVAESGFENARSPSGAKGFWQFLKSTALEYGLEINSEIDERYNLEKSTKAACDFFRKSYENYHNWTLVAASYNMGRNGLNKQILLQNTNDYYDLALSDETSRYVFRVLAYKLILSNPNEYGFYLREKDLYQSIKTDDLQIDSTITDLTNFANNLGISYKMLKYFNPWLRTSKLTNPKRKTYIIKVIKNKNRIVKSFDIDSSINLINEEIDTVSDN